jgi:flagellar hook-basal body complex protein FliE
MKVLGVTDFAAPVNLAPSTSTAARNKTLAPSEASFGDVMMGMLRDLDGTLRTAEQKAVGGLTGEVPIQEVVETMVRAEQKVQMTSAVRDKIVSAYLELTRMPI